MKTHEELVNMSVSEREDYLTEEFNKIIENIPNGPRRNRLIGMQWEIQQLRYGKYKDDPMGLLLEINQRMGKNLGTMQEKFLEISERLSNDKLDSDQ